MRILLISAFFCLSLESAPAFASEAYRIGYRAASDMADRLWDRRYQRDCFRSDRFLAELGEQQQSLSSSSYHRGYRQGLQHYESKVARDCHGPAYGSSSPSQAPQGECPRTGFQHGAQLGSQVCANLFSLRRSLNTCQLAARSSCFDGLRQYVQGNCAEKLQTASYRQAENDCETTFVSSR